MLKHRDGIEKLTKDDFRELAAYQNPGDGIKLPIQLIVLPFCGKLLKYKGAKAKLLE